LEEENKGTSLVKDPQQYRGTQISENIGEQERGSTPSAKIEGSEFLKGEAATIRGSVRKEQLPEGGENGASEQNWGPCWGGGQRARDTARKDYLKT